MTPRYRFTGISFTPHTVRMRVGGVPVQARIRVNPVVPMVGHYKRHEPVVLIDRKIRDPRERQAIAVHEAGERWLRLHEGLGPVQAHRVAEREETRFARGRGIPMRRYVRNVESVFRQNAREGVRRRR
jgi:hypothetical protein